MKKICKYCGAGYDGDPGSSACPDCVRKQRQTSIRQRICRQCGIEFPGGPRAWYCPECRRVRKQEASRRNKANGSARPLGSTDQCEICGADYVVASGSQRYCPACAPDAVRAIDRQQSIAWNQTNTTPEQRRRTRKAAAAKVPCVVCGKLFVPTDPSITCSPECRRRNQALKCAAWEKANREARNQYHLARIKAKEAAMSPEEHKAYRDAINARARANYQKRKEKKNDQ